MNTNKNTNNFQETFGQTMCNDKKLAWLAGLFQAEASFQKDKRNRSKSNSPEYIPPPHRPTVKLEMIEQDLMETVGEYLGIKVTTVTRKTSAGNTVYRIFFSARKDVELFLKAIFPYVIGSKTRTRISDLLQLCDEYDKWVAEDGKRKAAQLANKASQLANKERKKRKLK